MLNFGGNTLTISTPVSLDQNLSTASTPTFAGLNIPNLSLSSLTLSDTLNQLTFGSGITGILSWTPTGTDKTITLPNLTGEVSILGQTIDNSELTNSKVTVSTGTGLSGGGDISLGGSLTLTSSIDTASFATLTGTQTLTNKTLTSPTLTTPTLGVATATSVNKLTLTAPSSSATLTLADGSSLITSGGNSLTLTIPLVNEFPDLNLTYP